MDTKQTISVTVLADDAHRDDLAGLARALAAAGFVLTETLDAIGALIGTVPPAALAALSQTPGVLAVEEERSDYRPQPHP